MRIFKIISFCFILSVSVASPAYSLNVATHSHIDEAILTNYSAFGSYLRNNLDFEKGIDQSFKSNKVIDWIKLGGIYEDKPPDWYSIPYVRSANHFHDPISNKGYVLGKESSIRWAQDTNQFLGKYSWQDARKTFYFSIDKEK